MQLVAPTNILVPKNKHVLGCAKACLLFDDFDGTGGPKIVGHVTQRSINEEYVNALASQSLFIYDKPIDVLIYKNAIDVSTLVPYVEGLGPDSTQTIKFTGQNTDSTGTLRNAVLINGHHRRACISKYLDSLDPENQPWTTYKQLHQHSLAKPHDLSLKADTEKAKKVLVESGIWLVKFHDQGKSPLLPAIKGIGLEKTSVYL